MKITNEIIIAGVILLGVGYFAYMQYTKKENYVQSPPSVYNRLNDTPVQSIFRSAQDYADYAIDTGDKLLPLEFARTDFYKDVRKMQAGQSFDELSPTYRGDAFHRSIMRSSGSPGAFNDGKLRADAINSGDVMFFNELTDNAQGHRVSAAALPTEDELFPQADVNDGGLYWAGYFDDSIGQ